MKSEQKKDQKEKAPQLNLAPSRPRPSSHWRSVLSTASSFLLAALLAIFIATFVAQSYRVDGESMETALRDNDRLIINKWPRTWARLSGHQYIPNRGDIIIFNQPALNLDDSGSKQLIKRVIGLPDERVVVSGGTITIYNKERPSGFDPDRSGNYQASSSLTTGDVDVTLASDEIFVSGDNRSNSEDSRYFGPVKVDQIVGKLTFRIFPLDEAQKF